ncbi:MAG: hypothetical protein ACRDMV_22650 [Streptosporangiales bacterium]
MFAETVRGTAVDEAGLREAWARVIQVLGEKASGWLGATAGMAADRAFVAILGFETREMARITMDVLADEATWQAVASLAPDLAFREFPNVRAFATAEVEPTDRVEVREGTALDIGRVVSTFHAAERSIVEDAEVVGGLLCWDERRFVSAALYRRTVRGDQRGERRGTPADWSQLMAHGQQWSLAQQWSVLALTSTAGSTAIDHGGRGRS